MRQASEREARASRAPCVVVKTLAVGTRRWRAGTTRESNAAARAGRRAALRRAVRSRGGLRETSGWIRREDALPA